MDSRLICKIYFTKNKLKSYLFSLLIQYIPFYRSRRDNSLPSHTGTTEKDEKEDASEVAEQPKNTRKRTRTTECESLSDVQAYTMLDNATEPVEIQS